ncbi:MAG: hypothetical protein QM770_17525 [Tepidisphaeraceae bacterium]
MSTAAPTRSSDFVVARTRGVCVVTGEPIAPGETYTAALRETPAGFERIDIKQDRWDAFDRKDVVAFWRAKMPVKDAVKKKLFVDDAVLLELLEKLADVDEPAKLSFRFVLMLILMRKRLVTYESQRAEKGHDIWRVKIRGRENAYLDVIDPKPTEEQIAQVQEQLGQILSEEA